jgi:hypothetical protein
MTRDRGVGAALRCGVVAAEEDVSRMFGPPRHFAAFDADVRGGVSLGRDYMGSFFECWITMRVVKRRGNLEVQIVGHSRRRWILLQAAASVKTLGSVV